MSLGTGGKSWKELAGRGRMYWESVVNAETDGNKQLTQLLTPGCCGKQRYPEPTHYSVTSGTSIGQGLGLFMFPWSLDHRRLSKDWHSSSRMG